MKKKIIKVILFLIFSLLLFYFAFLRNHRERTLIKEGNQLVLKIEEYKRSTGALPNALQDIGIVEREDSPPYYEKVSDSNYMIWFGTSLGESKTYYSDSKQWEDFDRSME